MHRTLGPLHVEAGDDKDVVDHNKPHPDQPGLWLQWVPSNDGQDLEWDGGEKFYYAAEWMKYVVEKLLAPSAEEYLKAHIDEDPRLAFFTHDHVLNGVIEAQGEETDDAWLLSVDRNKVGVSRQEVQWGPIKEI